MTKLRSKTMTVLAMALAGTLFASPALADKPAHAGGGKPDRHQAAPGDRGPGAKAEVLDDAEWSAREQALRVEDLLRAERIVLTNALRGVVDARLAAGEAAHCRLPADVLRTDRG